MKKVVIINSPLYEEKNSINNEDYLPPLGLGIIYSSIENKFDVVFIDSLVENLDVSDLIIYLNEPNIDFVCINIFTTNYILVKKIVEKSSKNIHWIIGGISTKSLYKEIFNWKAESIIDIVYGDGEKIVNDIIDSSVKEEPKDINVKRRFYIVDSKSCYYNNQISNEKIDRSIFKLEPEINFFKDQEICIYTSRGCPYNCAYCVAAHSRNIELGIPRHKKPERIINELKEIKELYPSVNTIRIVDDLFLSNKQSFIDAFQIFSNFDFNWRAMCHIKSISNINDNSLISNLLISGCKELFIGIESGSSNILKEIHKTYAISVIKESIIRILDIGISVKGYFICGFPNEKIKDLDRTYDLASYLTDYAIDKKLHFRNSTFQFRPYFGTELYDSIVKKNNLANSSILYNTCISDKINFNIRNKSFNFDSGNYSSVNDDILHSYLKKMNDLNDRTA